MKPETKTAVNPWFSIPKTFDTSVVTGVTAKGARRIPTISPEICYPFPTRVRPWKRRFLLETIIFRFHVQL